MTLQARPPQCVYDDLVLIGDELHYDGELIALVVDTVSASTRGRFDDLIREGVEQEEADEDENTVLDHLWSKATDKAKGGLLRMSDLAIIVRKLKEGK